MAESGRAGAERAAAARGAGAAASRLLASWRCADEMASQAFARALAPILGPGDAVLLSGGLGAGKSVIARAAIQALGGGPEVPSPTFTLVQPYRVPVPGIPSGSGGATMTISHFDLYRLAEPEEAIELGWEAALAEGPVLVEWPERLGALTPPEALWVEIERPAADPGARRLTLTGPESWARRLPPAARGGTGEGGPKR